MLKARNWTCELIFCPPGWQRSLLRCWWAGNSVLGASRTHEEATCLDRDGILWRASASECCTPLTRSHLVGERGKPESGRAVIRSCLSRVFSRQGQILMRLAKKNIYGVQVQYHRAEQRRVYLEPKSSKLITDTVTKIVIFYCLK